MVANLSAHKRGWDDRWESFSDVAERGMALQTRLLQLVDEDTAAFDAIMAAFGMPKGNPAQKAERSAAIQAATLGAMETPPRWRKWPWRPWRSWRTWRAGEPHSRHRCRCGRAVRPDRGLGCSDECPRHAAD